MGLDRMTKNKAGVTFEGAQVNYLEGQRLSNERAQKQQIAQQRIMQEQRLAQERMENERLRKDQLLLGEREVFKRQREEAVRLQKLQEQRSSQNTDMVASSSGIISPVPYGANGPYPTKAPGIEYQGGSGGSILHSSVANLRIMYDNSENTGNPNHRARTIYSNNFGQAVDPITGQSNDKSKTHIFHDKGKDR
jgi:TolA-binding protein